MSRVQWLVCDEDGEDTEIYNEKEKAVESAKLYAEDYPDKEWFVYKLVGIASVCEARYKEIESNDSKTRSVH